MNFGASLKSSRVPRGGMPRTMGWMDALQVQGARAASVVKEVEVDRCLGQARGGLSGDCVAAGLWRASWELMSRARSGSSNDSMIRTTRTMGLLPRAVTAAMMGATGGSAAIAGEVVKVVDLLRGGETRMVEARKRPKYQPASQCSPVIRMGALARRTTP